MNYVQVYLTEKTGDYLRTFELKIHIYLKYTHIPIDQHLDIFIWLNKILSEDYKKI
jgi:hypothetical protein